MGKKKTKFLDTKNIGKNFVPAVVDAGVSSGGYLAGKIVANKISAKNPKFVKAKGPVAFLLGTTIAAVSNTKDRTGQMLKNFGIGISTYGGAEMADAFIPEDTKAKLGLSGLGITEDEANKIAQEAAAEIDASMSGVYDENAYLPTGDEKPIDINAPEGGYAMESKSITIEPTPMPKTTAQNTVEHFAKAVPFAGTDDDLDDDELDAITEQLI